MECDVNTHVNKIQKWGKTKNSMKIDNAQNNEHTKQTEIVSKKSIIIFLVSLLFRWIFIVFLYGLINIRELS